MTPGLRPCQKPVSRPRSRGSSRSRVDERPPGAGPSQRSSSTPFGGAPSGHGFKTDRGSAVQARLLDLADDAVLQQPPGIHSDGAAPHPAPLLHRFCQTILEQRANVETIGEGDVGNGDLDASRSETRSFRAEGSNRLAAGQVIRGDTMLRLLGNPKRLCDGMSRRDLLHIGGLGAFGFARPIF